MFLQKLISKRLGEKKKIFVGILKPLTKRVGSVSGAGSVSQHYGSADRVAGPHSFHPDPDPVF